jgi:nitrate/nitrite transporter NarK
MSVYEKSLFTFAIFWIGFLARPVGGLVLGPVGDRMAGVRC